MAFSNQAISETFNLTDTSGNKLRGDLVYAAVESILHKEAVLFHLGAIRFDGGLNKYSGSLGMARRGSTIKITFSTDSGAMRKGLPDGSEAQKAFKAAELDIHIDELLNDSFRSNKLDALLTQRAGTIEAATFANILKKISKYFCALWYKNVINEAKKQKTGDEYDRFSVLTLNDAKATPEKVYDKIMDLGYRFIRKLDDFTSFIPKEQIFFTISPELKKPLIKHLGMLGRTVKYVEGASVDMLMIDGYRVIVDPMLNYNLNKDNKIITGEDLDLTGVHMVAFTNRIQYINIPLIDIASAVDPKLPNVYTNHSLIALFGIKYNDIDGMKNEVDVVVEKKPT